jgi:hypothetical protein
VRRSTPPGAASRLLALALLGALVPALAAAQARPAVPPRPPAPPGKQDASPRPAPRTPGDSQNVEVDPIRWTRTSGGAVRIGELFAYTLTCAP